MLIHLFPRPTKLLLRQYMRSSFDYLYIYLFFPLHHKLPKHKNKTQAHMLLALFFFFLFLTNHHGNLFLKVDELLITPAPTTL
jgi:hypothetical protein